MNFYSPRRCAESRDPAEAEIRKLEARIARLVEAIATGDGGSAALGAKLRAEERPRLEELRAARRPAAPRPRTIPGGNIFRVLGFDGANIGGQRTTFEDSSVL